MALARDLPQLSEQVAQRVAQLAADHETAELEGWPEPPAAEAFVLASPDGRAFPFAHVSRALDRLWLVRGWIVLDEETGLADLEQLAVEPLAHRSHVSAELLRALAPAAIRDAVVARARSEALLNEIGLAWATSGDTAALAASDAPARGRPPKPEAFYAEVAEDYLEICSAGRARRVRIELAERYGRPPETVRAWVRRARELGLLSSGRQGRPGGEPGPRLLELRKEVDGG